MTNLVFCILDAVRADRVGYVNGDMEYLTPFMSDIADSSITADRCYSQGNATEQEMCTMMSGRYPEEHGVVGQDHPNDLPDDFPTLMEVLQEQGYTTNTVSFTSKALKRGSNTFKSIEQSGKINDYVNQIIPILDEPWALFLHYMDAHVPYTAIPEHYRTLYTGEPTIEESTIDQETLMGPTPRPSQMEAEIKEGVDPHYFTAKYEAAVSLLDRRMEHIYSTFVDGNDTVMLITADHGESLTDHGIYFDHRGLYECSVNIPLMITSPNISGSDIDGFVEHVDYFETVCDLLDVESPETSGQSIVNGSDKTKAHFCENTWNSGRGVVTDSWKYITYHGKRLHDAKDVELYNIDRDPYELNNIAWRYKHTTKGMQQRIDMMLNSLDIEYDPIVEEDTTLPDNHPSDEVKQRLEDLGYI